MLYLTNFILIGIILLLSAIKNINQIKKKDGDQMKKLPLGIQSFRKIIEGNYLYVDKTVYIYKLINNASYYFLSRPRRFGKSLLIDTIKEVFKGDKEIFNGLWIYNSDYEFKSHPVIHLDMSNISSKNDEILEKSIISALRIQIEEEGFNIEDNISSDIFKNLIRLLYKKYNKGVIVLIDEYDKPIIDHLSDIETAEKNRMVLKGFYGILKSMDPYLKFALISGVTKFTKTSIFSEMNNLMDITLTEDYSNICGITHKEFTEYFSEHIEKLQNINTMKQYKNIKEEIIKWYNGYSWDGKTLLLNPYSLLSFFSQKRFSGFWFSSGTPKFLMDLLKEKPEGFLNIQNLKITEWLLDSSDIKKIQVEPLLFQTGYLTIKEKLHDGVEEVYLLKFPNYEVEQTFNMHIISEFTEAGDSLVQSAYINMRDAFVTGDLEKILYILKGLFSSIPYNLHINKEAYYHSIFYAIMQILGFKINVEVAVSRGRIDGVLELDDKVYIMEFKYADLRKDETDINKEKAIKKELNLAMVQLKDRGYADKYMGSNKKIYQVAMAFIGRDNIDMQIEKTNL